MAKSKGGKDARGTSGSRPKDGGRKVQSAGKAGETGSVKRGADGGPGGNKGGASGDEETAGKGGPGGSLVEHPPTKDPLQKDSPPPSTGGKGKNKGGRPNKEAAAEKEALLVKEQKAEWLRKAKENTPLVSELLCQLFDAIAERKGEHWKLKSKESERMATTLGVVVEKWLPDAAKRYEEEIALGMVVGTACVVRLRIDRDERAHRESQRSPRDNGDQTLRQNHTPEGAAHTLA